MDLHTIKDEKTLQKLLENEEEVDINRFDEVGDAPLHRLVRMAVVDKKWYDLLWCFLVYCNRGRFDVNIKNSEEGKTALHIATENNDLDVVKALVVFGADVNCLNSAEWSPMDHAVLNNSQDMLDFLQSRNALAGRKLRELKLKGEPIPDAVPEYLRLEGISKIDMTTGAKGETPLEANVTDGERILCLDGGGCKGLIIIEILEHLEKISGRRIVKLFDWIVATSAGAIIALSLVYLDKTLPEMKQLVFKMAKSVFGTGNRYGVGLDSAGYNKLLKDFYKESIKMCDRSEPKVLISAVDASDSDLKLVFFNNCLFNGDSKYREALIWKVARYTSSGPVYFEPEDNYIDGGLKANNPTDFGLTVIQKELDAQQEEWGSQEGPKYACVASVGCGKYPPVEIGDFSIQKYMTIGPNMLRLPSFFSELRNLLKLLGTACSLEENVAESCKLRCEKQGIPFYRFSPALDVRIGGAETDAKLLCNLILKAQAHLAAWGMNVYRLRDLLLKVERNRREQLNKT